jgi:hydrogenase maturation protease
MQMAVLSGTKPKTRLLCLGNDILTDDAFGILVGEKLQPRLGDAVDIVTSMESGFYLMDHLIGVERVIVIDTIQTGQVHPGTIWVATHDAVEPVNGGSPHYIGLFETMEVGKGLGLPVADELVIVAVEAADCTTVGGVMDPAVRRAIPRVARLVGEMIGV